MSQQKILSIVIPAYNEGRTINLILDRVKSCTLNFPIEKEVIIVNDCSKDNTEEAILQYKSFPQVANPVTPKYNFLLFIFI